MPLRERKQQRAREQIVEAAFALFAERGFADVTVADIAKRAEVGRTTFFRYFGDKQEVVFSDEQLLLEELAERHQAQPPVTELAEAVAQIRTVVLELCHEFTANEEHYRAHAKLLDDNPELRDRAARKFARLAEVFRTTLRERGAPPVVAALAPQIALACFHAGQDIAGGDPAALPGAVDAAFAQLSELASPHIA